LTRRPARLRHPAHRHPGRRDQCPSTVAADLAAYRAAGLPYLHARFIFGALDDPDVFRRSFGLFVDEVIPRLGVDPIPGSTGDQVGPG
jgi:hypothetical protein